VDPPQQATEQISKYTMETPNIPCKKVKISNISRKNYAHAVLELAGTNS
jgi:hypothetical protein